MVQTSHNLNCMHIVYTCHTRVVKNSAHKFVAQKYSKCVYNTQEHGNLLLVHMQWTWVATLDMQHRCYQYILALQYTITIQLYIQASQAY